MTIGKPTSRLLRVTCICGKELQVHVRGIDPLMTNEAWAEQLDDADRKHMHDEHTSQEVTLVEGPRTMTKS